MKIEVLTLPKAKTMFEGENVNWTNENGVLKVFVNNNLHGEFQPTAWDAVFVADEETE